MSEVSSQAQSPGLVAQQGPGVGRAILIGLRPLGLLALVLIVTLALNMLVRTLDIAGGFFVQQNLALIILVVGSVVAIVVYIAAIRGTLKRVEIWQQDGTTRPAHLALWSLGITALVVVLPIVVAIVLPQHPAP